MALYVSLPTSLSSSSANRTTTTATAVTSFDNRRRKHFLLSRSSNILSLQHRRHRVRLNPPLLQTFRVYSQQLQAEAVLVRKCSPFLESSLVSEKDVLQTTEWSVVPDIWRSSAEKFGDRVALVDQYHDPPTKMTYYQLEQEILDFAEGLRVIGVNPCDKLALFADNSCRWLVADQGIMATGAINVVRGSRSSIEELLQIYNHSESVALAVDNPELFNRIAEAFSSRASLKFVILLWGETSCLDKVKGVPVYSYNEIINLGRRNRVILLNSLDARKKYVYETISTDDVATLVYTSGTTGNPKGVMLTHRNLLHQINNYWDLFPAGPGDRVLSMLPPWHVYERSCEYFLLAFGVEQVYTTVKYLKEDLRRYQPTYMISVPIVFETLYSGIQKQISSNSAIRRKIALSCIKISMAYKEFKRIYEGKYLVKPLKQHSFLVALVDWLCARTIAAILLPLHLLAKKVVYSKIKSSIGLSKAGISGGGSLPLHVDRFFEAIDINIQVGYGLTETSPVVAARSLDCNVLGSVGKTLPHTEMKVVDSEFNEVLPHGSKGIVMVRGPQIMKGYYKNHLATELVLDEDGWLNTGDIGWIAPHHTVGRSRNCGGIVVLEGRGKDTIVLLTGENVEPSVLEEAALRSSMIQQILIIGQDRRRLGAIVVPNKEEVLKAAKKSSMLDSKSSELSKVKMASFLYEELRKWTADCTFQFGGPILVIEEPFTIENGLMTPTMKIRRDQVVNLYEEQIDNLYK